jgi:hypothetical protein
MNFWNQIKKFDSEQKAGEEAKHKASGQVQCFSGLIA